MLHQEALFRRACAAWFRTGGTDQPGADASRVENHGGKSYVVLRNVRGILAVYRVRNDGKLKRLVRLPETLREED